MLTIHGFRGPSAISALCVLNISIPDISLLSFNYINPHFIVVLVLQIDPNQCILSSKSYNSQLQECEKGRSRSSEGELVFVILQIYEEERSTNWEEKETLSTQYLGLAGLLPGLLVATTLATPTALLPYTLLPALAYGLAVRPYKEHRHKQISSADINKP
jgi:hypothetical protein